jgi:hypothetical protein
MTIGIMAIIAIGGYFLFKDALGDFRETINTITNFFKENKLLFFSGICLAALVVMKPKGGYNQSQQFVSPPVNYMPYYR